MVSLYIAPLRREAQARIAQLVEQRIENPRVAGSIPAPGTISFVLQRFVKSKVASKPDSRCDPTVTYTLNPAMNWSETAPAARPLRALPRRASG